MQEILKEMNRKWPQLRTILTLGSEGSVIMKDGSFIRQKAYPCEAVDTTGAGDTFSGFFTALSAMGKSDTQALEISSKASSLAVRKKGAASSIPYLEEVLAANFAE